MSSSLKQRRPGTIGDNDDDAVTEDSVSQRKTRTRRRSPMRLLFNGAVILLLGHMLIRGYYELELRITDSSLEAMLYMPISYFNVKYRQPPAARVSKRFVMSYNNTFVLHLDTDTARLAQFGKHNRGLEFQLFSATRLVVDEQQQVYLRKTISNHSEPQYWITTYPLVRYLVSIGHYGDAAVAISQLRLLDTLVHSNSLEYMFVFEDDARLSRDFLQTKEVQAPADADLVFLMKSALKTVPLRSARPGEPGAVRVISGCGMYGYVITKAAAKKVLQQLVYNKRDPIDVAIMKLAVHWLRVYLPLHGWPQVKHGAVTSSRRQYNPKS